MDWSLERYVRLYCRNTAGWLALCWQGRACWPLILKECNRLGMLPIKPGPRRLQMLAALIHLPLDVVEPGVADLLLDGCVTELETGYLVPNYYDANEAPASGAQRTRKWRDNKRLELDQVPAVVRDETSQDVTGPVTQRHLGLGPMAVTKGVGVTKRHRPRRNVTGGDEPSQDVTTVTEPVTPYRAVPSFTDAGDAPAVRAGTALVVVGEQKNSHFQKPPPAVDVPSVDLEGKAARALWERLERTRHDADLVLEKPPKTWAAWAHGALEKSNVEGIERAYVRYLRDPAFENHQWRIAVFMAEAVWSVRTAPWPRRGGGHP